MKVSEEVVWTTTLIAIGVMTAAYLWSIFDARERQMRFQEKLLQSTRDYQPTVTDTFVDTHFAALDENNVIEPD